jgi:hypothetical protein
MSYSQEISRQNPTCFIFVLDQSGSMADPFGQAGIRKADFVADVVNRTLHDLVIRCTRTDDIRDYYHISVLGYGSTVGPAFGGALAGKSHVSVKDVAEMPAKIDTRIKKISDGAGGLVDQQVKFPVWMEPVANGGTPMCQAFGMARDLLQAWTAEHKFSFPPTVLHLTDGESTDGDPSDAAQGILGTGTSDGATLLFNCHVSARHSLKSEYPGNESNLPDDFARTLYRSSSMLPDGFRRAGTEMGLNLDDGARGFVFNGDPVSVAQFFEIGTRPANLR